jgi:hypothetical protein
MWFPRSDRAPGILRESKSADYINVMNSAELSAPQMFALAPEKPFSKAIA